MAGVCLSCQGVTLFLSFKIAMGTRVRIFVQGYSNSVYCLPTTCIALPLPTNNKDTQLCTSENIITLATSSFSSLKKECVWCDNVIMRVTTIYWAYSFRLSRYFVERKPNQPTAMSPIQSKQLDANLGIWCKILPKSQNKHADKHKTIVENQFFWTLQEILC